MRCMRLETRRSDSDRLKSLLWEESFWLGPGDLSVLKLRLGGGGGGETSEQEYEMGRLKYIEEAKNDKSSVYISF